MDAKPKKKRSDKYEKKVGLETSFEEALKLTFAKNGGHVATPQEQAKPKEGKGKKK